MIADGGEQVTVAMVAGSDVLSDLAGNAAQSTAKAVFLMEKAADVHARGGPYERGCGAVLGVGEAAAAAR